MRYFVDIKTGIYGDADDIRIIDADIVDTDDGPFDYTGWTLETMAGNGDDAAITLHGSMFGLTVAEWADERND